MLKSTMSLCSGMVLKPGLDVNPDPESHTVTLGQLVANYCRITKTGTVLTYLRIKYCI